MVAFALRADGWYLRQDIIWSKPNPMPESVTDRCTKAHEYIFLLSKSAKYYYDADAIKEQAIYGGTEERIDRALSDGKSMPTKLHNGIRPRDKRAGVGRISYGGKRNGDEGTGQESFVSIPEQRNKRSVWTVTTQPFLADKSISFDLADYVGDDGKPYKASEDCPIHGPMLHSGMFDKAVSGGQPIRLKKNNRNKHSGPVSLRETLPVPMISRNHLEEVSANVPMQTHESMDARRMSDDRHECTLPDGTACRIDRTSKSCEPADGKKDFSIQTCVETATCRNKQKNKTDHVDQTSLRDTASVQTSGHKLNIGLEPAQNDLVEHRIESNILPDDSSVHLSDQKPFRIFDKVSCKEEYCTCQIMSIDHFATFPPALITPCILAGCPEHGTVLDPFGGSGTVGEVAETAGRNSILIELNPKYCEMAKRRTAQQGLFARLK
jgi:hypothetical protein